MLRIRLFRQTENEYVFVNTLWVPPLDTSAALRWVETEHKAEIGDIAYVHDLYFKADAHDAHRGLQWVNVSPAEAKIHNLYGKAVLAESTEHAGDAWRGGEQ